MGIGDWGLGIGDWGLGIGDWGLGIVIDTVPLGILTLMVAQVVVVVDVVHEAGLVALRCEAELVVGHLLVGRNVEGIIAVAVAVHVVRQHVRVLIATAPCLVDERVVVAALVVQRSAGNETVGRQVGSIVQHDVVRTLIGGDVGESRLCSRTGQ